MKNNITDVAKKGIISLLVVGGFGLGLGLAGMNVLPLDQIPTALTADPLMGILGLVIAVLGIGYVQGFIEKKV